MLLPLVWADAGNDKGKRTPIIHALTVQDQKRMWFNGAQKERAQQRTARTQQPTASSAVAVRQTDRQTALVRTQVYRE